MARKRADRRGGRDAVPDVDAGPERVGIGSADSAHAALMRFLTQKAGVDAGAVLAKDGSGLSTLDRVTPRALVKVLA